MPSFTRNTSGGASVSGGALAPRSRRGNTNQADAYWRGGGGASFSSEYLAINGGNGSTQTGIQGGTGGRWIEGSQTFTVGTAFTLTVGAANSISVCGISDGSTTPTGGTLYLGSGGSQSGNGDYNLGHDGGGGGGGAGGNGGNGSLNQGATGGAGRATSITGSSATYTGGGGGASARNGGGTSQAAGGSGGAGTGSNYNYGCAQGTNGSANTGSGGGGNAYCTHTTGGSGRVVLAYLSSNGPLASIDAGLTYSLSTVSRSGYHVYTFTGGTGPIIP